VPSLCVTGFSDKILSAALPLHMAPLSPLPLPWHIVLYALAIATVLLSIQPALNLISPHQVMNYSYNRFHLVNAYGAFGSVGRERYEIVIEGTSDAVVTPATQWLEYGFKAKPGDPARMPPQIAPYHLRLDWLIWFLPFSVGVSARGIRVPGYELWFLRFVRKLLQNDAATLRLMGKNSFVENPPQLLRAIFYRYRFSDPKTKTETGAWWTREELGMYLPPVSLEIVTRLF
jgi:hypothetical protein